MSIMYRFCVPVLLVVVGLAGRLPAETIGFAEDTRSFASRDSTRVNVGTTRHTRCQNPDESLALASRSSNYSISGNSAAGIGLGSFIDFNFSEIDFASSAVSPGLLTSINPESPYPTNRVFFSYSYCAAYSVLTTSISGFAAPSSRVSGFDLHRFDVGLEKAIFGNRASIYVRGPFLDSENEITDTVTGRFFPLPAETIARLGKIDGPGNVSAGFKVLLLNDTCSNVFTAGLTVSAPTARGTNILVGADPTEFVEVNPTYLQPWIAGQLNGERLFLQSYLGVVVPTDERVATAFNVSLSVGRVLFQNPCRVLSSVTPVINMQILAPFDRSEETVLTFEDQFFVAPGLIFGLGQRAQLQTGMSAPFVGPQAFDVGVSTGLNIFF